MDTLQIKNLIDLFADHDEDICHITCDDDDNKSLCGLDITNDPWNENPRPEDECIVCRAIDAYLTEQEEHGQAEDQTRN